MEDEFEIRNQQNFFDFKGFLIKILSYWPLFLICLAIAFYIAHYINVRKQTVYRISNMITVKDDQNPFFTSNTSLTFNWGGTTDKVQTAEILLKSRSHNEEVVRELKYYIEYLRQGEYHLEDVYGKTPFSVDINTNKTQLINKTLKVVFVSGDRFELSIEFNGGDGVLQDYKTDMDTTLSLPKQNVSSQYALGDPINLPYLNFKLQPTAIKAKEGEEYYIRFNQFDNAVNRYNSVSIEQTPRGSSILSLNMVGTNKKRLVDYLNTSVRLLSESQLERKNLFATKTIQFIDSSLAAKTTELQNVQDELNSFRDQNKSVGISGDETSLITKITDLDLQKQNIEQQLQNYSSLQTYLRTHQNYATDFPAPSIAGIDEGIISQGVASLVELSEERNRLKYTAKPGNPVFSDLDRRIDAIKNVILENIQSSQDLMSERLNDIRRNIANAESQMRTLPKEQQELLSIQRRYSVSESTYGVFMEKRNEAGIIKAANVSDIQVIDSAKDTGGGAIGPNTNTNYVMAAIAGSIVPFVFVFLLVFFDNKIGNPDEIKNLSRIPILGTIGKSTLSTNLIVLKQPKSAIAEAFRGLRSSLQFIYRNNNITGAKTVMVTSSVSGEGKTFCSINLATVFALSERKTVLVGLDLRKPKIFDDFALPNEVGVVDYLVGRNDLEEIIQKTEIPHLDVILAGEIPPNPSELLMSEQMDKLMRDLKEEYDYIILDTPPVGLVSDSMELQSYADATLYILRQNFTNKGMLQFVNEKYRKGEIGNISFVLNCFRMKGKYGYGYGYGYGGYGKAYHEEDDSGLKNRINKLFGKLGRK